MNITGYKKKKMEENKKSLCRIPKSIINDKQNNVILRDLYTMGGHVGVGLIIYLCRDLQRKDLFGDCGFTIDEFSRIMGFSKNHLYEKLSPDKLKRYFGEEYPKYIYKDENGKTGEHRIENLFECILHKMGLQTIALPVYAVDGGFVRQKFIPIIDQYDIKDNFKSSKRTKRIYRAKINNELKEALFYNYNLIELNEYRQIPDRIGYREFYLNICRMIALVKYKKQQGLPTFFTMTVNQLADIFNINAVENKVRKMRVSRTLEAVNKSLKIAKFNYEYIKGENERWAYTVKFEFSEDALAYFDEEYKAVFMKRYYDNLLFNYIKMRYPTYEMRRILLERTRFQQDDAEKEIFRNWMFSGDDREMKLKTYQDTSAELLRMNPEDTEIDIDELFKRMQQSN